MSKDQSKTISNQATPNQNPTNAYYPYGAPNAYYSTQAAPAPQRTIPTKKPMDRTKTTFIVACAALILGAGAFLFSAVDFFTGDTPLTINSTSTDGNSANFTEGSIAEIAAKVSPSVVSIVTETRTTGYFGQDSTSSAAGSGFIVSADGYVVTNKHVVSDANQISVILDDGTTYSNVQVVATDPLNDVAFLKIDGASDLTTLTIGSSTTLSVGQQVIAIGNALGQYSNSVTSGIISGVGRTITATDEDYTSSETLTDMIQTDASINAGNSGGPLINAAGEVIGINTAVVSGGNGIGFAIPISSIKGMLNSLLETGSAQRAYLGIYGIALTSDIAQQYNLSVSEGAYVYNSSGSALVAGGPAASAGVREGDIIVSVNGAKVGEAGSITSLIGEYKPGDTVQLGIIRDGSEMAINVTLGAYSE